MNARTWFVAALGVALLSGCAVNRVAPGELRGSGNYVTRKFDVRDFSGVEAGGGFRVNISRGDAFEVAITAEDNIMDVIKVAKIGEILHIGFDNRRFASFNTGRLEANIQMPALKAVEASGGSRFAIAGFKSIEPFRGELSGGSWLTGAIDAGNISIDGNGGSNATLAGKAAQLVINGSGGGRLDVSKLSSDRAQVSLSGGTDATVNTRQLNYSLSGGSVLRYRGRPEIGHAYASGGASAIPIGP